MEGFLIVIMFALLLWGPIYRCFDHTEYPSLSDLRPDATIVNITHKRFNKKIAKFRTTIEFSDGFRFWAYDTIEHSFTIEVTPELKYNMIRRAINLHCEALMKAEAARNKELEKAKKELQAKVQKEIPTVKAEPTSAAEAETKPAVKAEPTSVAETETKPAVKAEIKPAATKEEYLVDEMDISLTRHRR